MSATLRCAVIGTGAIGFDHLNGFLHCRRATVVAIAEKSPARAKEAADRFKIPRSYADYQELLEQPDLDAVTIALPNHLHAPVAIEALKARKHVLLEKPMAMNAAEAFRIIETAKKIRRTLMVGMNFRFDRQTQIARQFIQRGDLGEIYHARAFWLRRSGIPRTGSWFTQKGLAGGGCTVDLGVHMLDVCLHLLDDFEVTRVSAQTFAKFGPRGLGEFEWGRSEIDPKKPFDVEDYSVALIRFKSGKTLALESSWAANQPGDAREYGIDLLGTNAGLSLYPARLYRSGPSGYETVQLAAPKLIHFEDRIQHFVNCVLDGKKPLVPVEESLKVQGILDAIYESAATGKEVKIG